MAKIFWVVARENDKTPGSQRSIKLAQSILYVAAIMPFLHSIVAGDDS